MSLGYCYTVNADIAQDELTFYEHIRQPAGAVC
jgi:hypothetical protein